VQVLSFANNITQHRELILTYLLSRLRWRSVQDWERLLIWMTLCASPIPFLSLLCVQKDGTKLAHLILHLCILSLLKCVKAISEICENVTCGAPLCHRNLSLTSISRVWSLLYIDISRFMVFGTLIPWPRKHNATSPSVLR
jgi:hypothetical protein